ncbi:MAG: MBL fold metallo-hydrolase [Eubacteriales bacterium]|nr:MBL fold metallo-hydrolase [Eubacteriales bacterium]
MNVKKQAVLGCFGKEALALASTVKDVLLLELNDSEEISYQQLTAALAQNADENRVYLLGFGSGVKDACRFAARYVNCVAAMLLFGGSGESGFAEALRDTPIQLFSVPGDASLDWATALRAAGNRQFTQIVCASERDARQALPEAFSRLLTHDLRDRLSVRWLQPGLWNIESEKIDSFYLIEGRDKALVIDTGMGRRPVRPLLEQLTRLPMEAAFTHVHGDHLYHADEFERKYLSPKEQALLPVFVASMMPEKPYRMEDFTPIAEGDVLALGGNDIEVIALPGHTPGSVVFVDHVHRCLFTGDAFGSGIGVLMSISGALPLSEYQKELTVFRRKIAPYREYAMYGGHRVQEHGEDDGSDSYHPLCLEVVDDMITLCQKLRSGEPLPYELQRSAWTTEDVHYVRYGRAAMWVTPSQCLA